MLSDKVIVQSIFAAWMMNNGSVFESNGIEIVKEMSGSSMRHFVELPVGESTSVHQLNQFLKGYLISGSWTSLFFESPVVREVFEVLAQTAYEVHSVIEARKTLFGIGGQFFNANKKTKFNLFLRKCDEKQTLEKAGYDSQSYKFKLIFRQITYTNPKE